MQPILIIAFAVYTFVEARGNLTPAPVAAPSRSVETGKLVLALRRARRTEHK